VARSPAVLTLTRAIEGGAELRKGDLVIRADRLQYNQPTDEAKALGQVHINRAGNVYEGPALELRVDAFEGFFSQPSYQFLRNRAHGQAERIDFLDDQRAVIHNASFTTCKRERSGGLGARLGAQGDPPGHRQ
jgi:LPS-assembly protein